MALRRSKGLVAVEGIVAVGTAEQKLVVTVESELIATPEDSSPRLWFRRRNTPEDSTAPERLVETQEDSKLHQRTRAVMRQIRIRRSHQRTRHRI